MVLLSGLCSFRSCQLAAAHAPANLSLLIVRMDPSLSDGAAGDSGTKKKSSFQITSVRKGDTASLSSEVGAIDEFDVDNEEGDGEEDDDNLSASVALDQVGDEIIPDNSDLVGQTARGVPQSHSQSKYRVVRIKKQSVIDRHFERGRWECWDLRDGNLDPPHTQGEDEDDEAARKNDSPRRKSENCQDSESPGTPDEGKRNGYGGSGPEGTSAVATGDQRAAPGKRVAFVPVATSTIGNTSAVAVQDTPPSSGQPAADVLLASIHDAVRSFSMSHQQEVDALKMEVHSLNKRLTTCHENEKLTSAKNTRFSEDNEALLEETQRLTALVMQLLSRLTPHHDT